MKKKNKIRVVWYDKKYFINFQYNHIYHWCIFYEIAFYKFYRGNTPSFQKEIFWQGLYILGKYILFFFDIYRTYKNVWRTTNNNLGVLLPIDRYRYHTNFLNWTNLSLDNSWDFSWIVVQLFQRCKLNHTLNESAFLLIRNYAVLTYLLLFERHF